MKQLNFLLIFSFGLAMVMFTLENTAAATVHFLPGLSVTLPLAALLLIVGGIGATAAWVFAVWTGVVRKVETIQNQSEMDAQQVRIRELEDDLQRYRATVDAQLGLLPAAGESGGSNRESSDSDTSLTVTVN
ncbi:MAG: LapA family protein [Cyanobacteria bacterium K_DeepCast_35m_m2_023]|nr:LapA family protein [Cyanobacteria bacterium K_DeepCast_35m_m2_023]